jgi:hypothetical protein
MMMVCVMAQMIAHWTLKMTRMAMAHATAMIYVQVMMIS